MGFNWPQTHAKMREVKAEGGWAVVCTEERTIHPSSYLMPEPQARLWDEHDEQALGLMVEAEERHGALAGVELAHNGVAAQNFFTRLKPLGPGTTSGIHIAPTEECGRWT